MARALFIQTDWFEHLGILYLSAYLKDQGHQTQLVIGRRPGPLLRQIEVFKPNLVAMTTTTGSHQLVLKLARIIRQHWEGLLILGGPHPTFFPEVLAEPGIDMICRGEGEATMAILMQRLEGASSGCGPSDFKDIPGLGVKAEQGILIKPPAGLISDLDAIPFPDRELYSKRYAFFRRSSMRRMITMRGCPYECTYCYNKALKDLCRGLGPYLRQRSVENVLEEIKTLPSGIRTINFVDDTFGVNKRWAMEFLERYPRSFKYPFIINTRAELLDQDMVSGLADAGCYCVQMGVESGDEDLRREILGRKVSDERIIQAGGMLKSRGIRVLTYNMIGLPAETLDQAFATMDINTRLKTDFPRFSIYQPYPLTDLAEKAKQLGMLGHDFGTNRISESYFKKSVLKRDDIYLFENLHKLFYPAVRWPGTRRLIRQIIRMPSNPFFHLVFLLSMGTQYARATNRPFLETLEFGLRSLGNYFR
jgi:anaerobic magnesium-protoporphyrin IX monomethyl ester cyclase